jgi:hypothetical protein
MTRRHAPPRRALLALAVLVPALLGCARPSEAQPVPNPLQAELDALARHGGGVYRLAPGATVSSRGGVVVPQGVTFDLNGGTVVFTLAGEDDIGVRLSSNSAVRNGTIRVHSLGHPGIQGSIHAPILVGELYGHGGTPARPSPFVAPSGWSISHVTVSSDKAVRDDDGIVQGAAGVAVMGGSHDGVIEDVTVPDSRVMAGGIHLDWGTVGPIASSDIAGSARAYRAGLGYTTHPHDIVIRNIRIGRLTRPAIAGTGSFGVRLSGVDHIRIENVHIASVTEAGFLHTAGDLGYEFARPADRARAHKGNVLDGLTLDEADGAYLVRSDSNADNIYRVVAAGYRAMLPPIAPTDIAISHVVGRAGSRRSPNFGVRVDHQRGGTISDVTAIGFRRGFYIDEQVNDLALVRPAAEDSVEAGISIEHPTRPPAGVTVDDARLEGARAAARQLIVGRSDNVRVVRSPGALVRIKREAGRTETDLATPAARD